MKTIKINIETFLKNKDCLILFLHHPLHRNISHLQIAHNCFLSLHKWKTTKLPNCMYSKPLEEVSSFKYSTATLSKYGSCNAENRTSIATAMAAMASQCDTWTLLGEARKRIYMFENKCLRNLLRIYCKHRNQLATSKVSWAGRNHSAPLSSMRKMAWFCMPRGITVSARPACKALLKADASGDGNGRSCQISSKSGLDMTMR